MKQFYPYQQGIAHSPYVASKHRTASNDARTTPVLQTACRVQMRRTPFYSHLLAGQICVCSSTEAPMVVIDITITLTYTPDKGNESPNRFSRSSSRSKAWYAERL